MGPQEALVFSSVFPAPAASHTTPTPQATPDLAFTGPGQSFGGIGPSSSLSARSSQGRTGASSQDGPAQRQVKHNLAWSTTTQFLSLDGAKLRKPPSRHGEKRRTADVQDALAWLLYREDELDDRRHNARSSLGPNAMALAEWYLEEAREHFETVALPRRPDLG
ncbi:MAG: hypothetical protein INR71_10950, partial [Terriglobus roseus]|nr:hypothetical protein [Terriglobus roseus]